MLIEFVTTPRRDGSVLARMPDKTLYTFEKTDEPDVWVCDIPNDSHVAWLIGTGRFYPAQPDDFQAATDLVAGDDSGDEVPGDEGDAPVDDEGDESAAPVEANTPPAGKKRKAK